MMFLTKYKIKSNIDLCFNIKANNTLNLISQNNSVQNIIIYGPNGSGKKTLIDLFLKQLYGDNIFNITTKQYNVQDNQSQYTVLLMQSNYHLVINGDIIKNNNNLIQIINDYTKSKHMNFNKKNTFNEIIIYNVDKLAKNTQMALRRIIESTVKYNRFIFTCSTLSPIIDPIVSRCNILKVYPPTDTELLNIILRISFKEHFIIKFNDIIYILNNAHNNVSTCILLLESIINDFPTINEYKEIIDKIISIINSTKNITESSIYEIKQIIYNILSSYISYDNIIKDILLYYLNHIKDEQIQYKLIDIADYYDIKCAQSTNKIMILCNFIINIILVLKK